MRCYLENEQKLSLSLSEMMMERLTLLSDSVFHNRGGFSDARSGKDSIRCAHISQRFHSILSSLESEEIEGREELSCILL